MNIIFLGPPGAGKGTQGELLAEKLDLPRLSVGAILRRVLKEEGQGSKEIAEYMLKGLNVPAPLLFKVLESWFREHQSGFIVDNLPRNIDQLEEFKKFLSRTGIKIDRVLHLGISDEESVKRSQIRYQEKADKGEVRPDDELAIIETRLREGYQKDIEPILEYFRNEGILTEINGEQTVGKVHQDILESLNIK